MKQRKNGIPSLKVSTDLFARKNIKAIIESEGSEAITVLLLTFLKICDSEGYYLSFDDEFINYSVKYTGVERKKAHSIINASIRFGVFDSRVFEKYGILTNVELQKQYVASFYKRRYPMPVEKNIWLIGYEFKKDYTVKDTLKTNKFIIPYKTIEIAWNDVAEKTGIPKVKRSSTWSDSRKKHVAALVKRYGVEDVLSTIKRIGDSDFLSGKNNRNWQCKFSWFLEARNFEKISEGNYDNKKSEYTQDDNFIDLSEYL